MRATTVCAAVLFVAGVAGDATAQSNADLQAQVRDTETAFAKTMADRDHAGFTSFLAEEAVFFGGSGVALRGRAAVSEAWKPLYAGDSAPFSWAPDHVEVLESGDLAFSSGPVRAPGGELVGTFNSVWRRERDGRWRIVFDKGCPPCAAARPTSGSPSASGS